MKFKSEEDIISSLEQKVDKLENYINDLENQLKQALESLDFYMNAFREYCENNKLPREK